MKVYIINITFIFDDGNDSTLFKIFVPENVRIEEIKKTLLDAHDFLDRCEDEECLYENNGRNYESLLEYVSRKYGWNWDEFYPELEIELQ